MVGETWKDSARAFFDQRADTISRRPTIAELCYVSGRDPRLWSDQQLLDDLAASILEQSGADRRSALVEVGCAAGFIANLIAPRLREYVGVDLSAAAIRVARLLQLPNATFQVSAGAVLPFSPGRFDAAICYDVVTNFPDFDDIRPIVIEMLRLVRPGGRVLIGSVPDAAKQADLERRAVEIGRDLAARIGPVPALPAAPPPSSDWLTRFKRRWRTQPEPVAPQIVCYYFARDRFAALANELGVDLQLNDIHAKNPYAGLRFNAVFTKPVS